MNNTEHKQIIESIKPNMLRGDVSAIAETLKKSREYVSRVLSINNNLYNYEIVNEAAKLIEKRKKKDSVLLEKVQEING